MILAWFGRNFEEMRQNRHPLYYVSIEWFLYFVLTLENYMIQKMENYMFQKNGKLYDSTN